MRLTAEVGTSMLLLAAAPRAQAFVAPTLAGGSASSALFSRNNARVEAAAGRRTDVSR